MYKSVDLSINLCYDLIYIKEVIIMSKSKKKRTITPEHLAKMQEGKRKAKQHKERVAMLSDLDERLYNAKRDTDKPVRMTQYKRRKKRK